MFYSGFDSLLNFSKREWQRQESYWAGSPNVASLAKLFQKALRTMPFGKKDLSPARASDLLARRIQLQEAPQEIEAGKRFPHSYLRSPSPSPYEFSLPLLQSVLEGPSLDRWADFVPDQEGLQASCQSIKAFEEATIEQARRESFFSSADQKKALYALAGNYVQKLQDLSAGDSFVYRGVVRKPPGIISKAVDKAAMKWLPSDFAELLVKPDKDLVQQHILKGFQEAGVDVTAVSEVMHDVANLARAWSERLGSLNGGPMIGFKRGFMRSLEKDIEEIFSGNETRKELGIKLWNALQTHGFEQAIKEGVDTLATKIASEAYQGKHEVLSQVESVIPPELMNLMEALELDSANEPLCLQIQRQPGDPTRFTLLVFCKESSHNPELTCANSSNKTYLPLCFKDLELQQLDQEFFAQLLCYENLPKWDSQVKYSLQDFYNGLIASLGKTAEEATDIAAIKVGSFTSPSAASMFQLYFRYQLGKTEEEFAKYLFDVRLKTVMSLYESLKNNPTTLVLNGASETGFCTLMENLTKETFFFKEKGGMSDDEFRDISETLHEIQTLYDVQKKSTLVKTKQQAAILPPQVKQMVQEVFTASGVKLSEIEFFKAALIEVMGEEVRESLEIALKEILPEKMNSSLYSLLPKSLLPSFTLQDMKREIAEIKNMRLSLLHAARLMGKCAQISYIFFSIAMSKGLLQHLLIRFVPALAINQALLWAITPLLMKYGPSGIKRFVPADLLELIDAAYGLYEEVYAYIQKRVLVSILAIILRKYVGQRELESTRQMLINVQQEMSRDGKLSFDVKCEVDPSEISEKPPETTSTKSEETPQEVKEQAKQALVVKAGIEEFVKGFKEKLITNASPTPKGLFGYLFETTETFEALFKERSFSTREAAVDYLMHRMRNLPIPQFEEADYWSKIPAQDLNEVMQELGKVMLYFHTALTESVVSPDKMGVGIQAEIVKAMRQDRMSIHTSELTISLFSVYACMDKVARSIDQQAMEGYAPNGLLLKQMIEDPNFLVLNPLSIKKLGDVAAYFGISDSFSYAAAYGCRIRRQDPGLPSLFNDPFFKPTNCTYNGIEEMTLSAPALVRSMQDPAQQFYFQFATHPYVSYKIRSKLGDKPPDYQVFFLLCTEKGILPPWVEALRHAHHLASSVAAGAAPLKPNQFFGLPASKLKEGLTFTHITSNGPADDCVELVHMTTFNYFRKKTVQPSLRLLPGGLSKKELKKKRISRRKQTLLCADGVVHGLLSKTLRPTQEEALAKPRQDRLDFFSGEKRDASQLQMALTAPGDAVLRTLGHFTSKPSLLFKKVNVALLTLELLRVGELEEAIKNAPHATIKGLEQFFTFAIEHTQIGSEDVEISFSLALLAAQVKDRIALLAPELKEELSDFRKYLRKDIRGYAYLAQSYLHVYPSEGLLPTPADLEQAVIDLKIAENFSSFSASNHTHIPYLRFAPYMEMLEKRVDEERVDLAGRLSEQMANIQFFDAKELASASPSVSPTVSESSPPKEKRLLLASTSQLNLLKWFCDRPIFKTDPQNLKVLARIELPLQKSTLVFNIERETGKEARAYSDSAYPGYFLSLNQKHTTANCHPRSLILENNEGSKLVLVRPESLMHMGSVKTYTKLGFTPSQLMEKMAQVSLKEHEFGEDYFTYTLDKDGTLQSDDPLAKLYLLLFHFTHGETNQAFALLQQIEDFGRREPFPPKVLEILDQCALPLLLLQSQEAEELLLRTAAIRTENDLIHRQEAPSLTWKSKQDVPIEILSHLALYISLHKYVQKLEEGVKPYLTTSQERFLFRRLKLGNESLINVLLEWQEGLPKRLKAAWITQTGSDLAMLPALKRRMLALNEELGEPKEALSAIPYLFKATTSYLTSRDPLVDGIGSLITTMNAQLKSRVKSSERNPHIGALKALLQSIQVHRNPRPSFGIEHNRFQDMYESRNETNVPVSVLDLTHLPTMERYFLHYYRLAKGEGQDKALQAQLNRNLHLLRGRYPPQLHGFIQILQGVAFNALPFSPPPTKTFDQLLEAMGPLFVAGQGEETPHSRYLRKKKERKNDPSVIAHDKFISLLKKLSYQMRFKTSASHLINKESLKTCSDMAKKQLAKKGVGMLVTATLTATGVGTLRSAYQWGSSALSVFHAVSHKTHTLFLKGKKRSGAQNEFNREPLIAREKGIDNLFEDILNTFIKNGNHPNHLKSVLMGLKKEVEGVIEKEKTHLTKLANQPPENLQVVQQSQAWLTHRFKGGSKNTYELTFEAIFSSFAQGKEEELLSHWTMNQDKLSEIKARTYLVLILTSRFNLLFKKMEEVGDGEWSTNDSSMMVEELKRRRVYSLGNGDEQLMRDELLLEASQKMMLWKKQHDVLVKMAESTDTSQTHEVKMGLGKTAVMLPVIGHHKSSGDALTVHVWPAPVAKTNIAALSKSARNNYSQKTNAFGWGRGPKHLETHTAMRHMFERCYEEKELLNTTKTNLQALELSFIEDLLKEEPQSDERNAAIEEMRKTLRLLRKKGKAVIDEVHQQLRPHTELNYPMGKKKSLKDEDLHLMKEIMISLVSLKGLQELIGIKVKSPNPLSREEYKKQVLPRLAEAVVAFPELEIPANERQELLDYLTGRAKKMPTFVLAASDQKKHQLGLAKGVLTIILPMCLEKYIYSDFTISKEKRSEESFARPSEGNDNPVESSTIKNPLEAFIKTAMLKFNARLSLQETEQFLHLLQTKVNGELLFADLCPHRNLGEKVEELIKDPEVIRALTESDRVTADYTAWDSGKKISYFSENLSSNSINFASMFESDIDMTGTPYNPGSYPVGAKVTFDQEAREKTYAMLREQEVDTIADTEPLVSLKTLLEKYFSTDESCARTIIDYGALMCGLSNEKVARVILSFIAEKRPDILGVVFYNQQKELMILEKGAKDPIPLSATRLKANERITYYDECHTYAADVPQMKAAKGIVTLKPPLFAGLSQAAFRMRGMDDLNQTLTFVAPNRVKEVICPGDPLSMDLVVDFSIDNEKTLVKQEDFFADSHKIHNVLRRKVLDKILDSSLADMLKLARRNKELFVTEVSDQYFDVYGWIDCELSPTVILDKSKATLVSIAKREGNHDQALSDELAKIGSGSYPEKIHAYQKEGSFEIGALHDLGRTQQVQQSQRGETNTQREEHTQKQEENNQQVSQVSTLPKTRFPSRWEWSDTLDLNDMSWCSPESVSPPIVSVKESVLGAAGNKDDSLHWEPLKEIISSHIYGTANFYQIIPHGVMGATIQPFSAHQKPAFHVLIVEGGGMTKPAIPMPSRVSLTPLPGLSFPKPSLLPVTPFVGASLSERTDVKLILLDQQDALFWQKKLQSGCQAKVKISLYDIENGLITHSTEPLSQEKLPYLARRSLCLIKLLHGWVSYNDKEKEILRPLLLGGKAAEIEQIFLSIHEHLGRGIAYPPSDLHALILEAKKRQLGDEFACRV